MKCERIAMCINHWAIGDCIKLVLLNKDSDKPKRSAYKCPTLHTQIVSGDIIKNRK